MKKFIESPYFPTCIILGIGTVILALACWWFYLSTIESLAGIGPHADPIPPLSERALASLPMIPLIIPLAFLVSSPIWALVLLVQSLVIRLETRLAQSGDAL